MKKGTSIIFILFSFYCFGFSQELKNVESIKQLIFYIDSIKPITKHQDSILYYCNMGLDAAQKIGDVKCQADLHKRLGDFYQNKGDKMLALEKYGLALSLFNSIKDTVNIISTNNELGWINTQLGNYGKATNHHFAAIKIMEESPTINYKGLARTYSNLGVVYRYIEDYPAAINALRTAETYYKKINDSINIAGTYLNFGFVYHPMKKWDSSYHYYTKALRIFEKLNHPRGIAMAYNNLVGPAKMLGKIDQAYGFAHIAYGMSLENDFLSIQISSLTLMADIKLHQKEFKEAERLFLRSQSLAEKGGSKRQQYDNYYGLLQCKRATKEYDKALEYYDLYTAVKDSIFNTENTSVVANLRISHEVAQKDAAIKLLEKDNEINELERKNLIFVGMAMLLILILIILILFIQIKKDRKLALQRRQLIEAEQAIINAQLQNRIEREEELTRELDFKNRALTTYTLNLVQKNAMLGEIRNLAVESAKKTEGKDVGLKKIVSSIDYSYTQDHDWDGFRTYFEQVHPDFFKNLKENFPELTTSELRLCALIRLSLSIKESAQLLSISPDSVKMARHRIRKKLSLELDNNLTEFIMTV